MVIPQMKRAEHMAIPWADWHRKKFLAAGVWLLRTSSAAAAFYFFDLHGDATPVLLQLLAVQEQAGRQDLSTK